MRFTSLLAGSAIALATTVCALPKVTRTGKYLYDDTGARFYVKGVAYQEKGAITVPKDGFQEPDSFIDPLSNPAFCNRDLPYLKQLGINAVRVYSVDPALNHDGCMAAFAAANIYTIVDLSQPLNGSIDRSAPKWTSNILNLYLQTIDAFSKYDNVLAYTVGNEVVIDVPSTVAGPFIKAAARDVKAYLKSKGYPGLVTYASTDGPAWRNELANYLACGDESTSIDMYGLNNYEWKGDSSIAAYGNTNNAFSNFNIPVYFSEFGSNAATRLFTEVDALFGEQMSAIWSGGLAFSYFQGTMPGFGLVDISEDGTTVTPNADFTALQTHYATVQFINTPAQASEPATTYPACAGPNANFLGSSTLPPTPNQAACNCAVEKAFPCVFSTRTPNFSAVVGPLFNFACAELGKLQNDACTQLASDGQAGTYGQMSGCDPSSQLSYVFSAYFEAQQLNTASCNFDGNATINTNAPTDAAAASAAARTCLAPAQGVSVPTGPTAPTQPSSVGGGGNGKPSTNPPGKGTGDNAASQTSSIGFVTGLVAAFLGFFVAF